MAVDAMFNIPMSIADYVAYTDTSFRRTGRPSKLFPYFSMFYGISLINCFITPIFYYLMNQAIQVSSFNI